MSHYKVIFVKPGGLYDFSNEFAHDKMDMIIGTLPDVHFPGTT